MEESDVWIPDMILLGPGGVKGYLELGFLLKLEYERYYSSVNEWMGCSVGAIICLLIVCGYSITDIINDCLNLNIINDISDINIDKIRETPGLLTIKSTENLIRQRVIQRFGMVPTMEQLYMATGMDLTVVTFNLDKMRPEYLNKDTEPNIPCITAVMMSSAIPAIVCPKVYKGYVYVDGAIGDPYPILYKDDGRKILGVYIDTKYTNEHSDKNWVIYTYRCTQASMKILRDRSLKSSSSNCKHVGLQTSVLDATGLSLDFEGKKSMIVAGIKSAFRFLNQVKSPDKYKIILGDNEEIPVVEDMVENQGVLDRETMEILNLLYSNSLNSVEPNYVEPNEPNQNNDIDDTDDLFISSDDTLSSSDDALVSSYENNTLLIPITPDIRMNIERAKRNN